MKNQERIFIIISLIVLVGLGTIFSNCQEDQHTKIPRGFVTNESFINGLYTGVDLQSTIDVFRYVFSNLNGKVTVYPSENYYYFQFPMLGKTLSGTLTLYPEQRDSAKIGFGYGTKVEDKARHKYYFIRGGGNDLSVKDGVKLRKINDFKYSVTFEGRTVIFNLYNPGLTQPQKALLRDDEEYVGTSFDESGLQFHLIFNNSVSYLFWILNEDVFVTETFSPAGIGIEDVIIGDRTEFAFYDDSLHSRKILIGVSGLNVLHNNWYDGPFDQLPDNYVYTGQIDMKKYLIAHYKVDSTEIDKYGNYNREARIPVAPYTVYFSKDELAFVDSCKELQLNTDEFCKCLTEQKFDVPKDLYKGVYRKFY